MNNGTRNWSAMTAYLDPSSKLFSIYEPCPVKKTLIPVVQDGKQLRVNADFIRQHKIPERTQP